MKTLIFVAVFLSSILALSARAPGNSSQPPRTYLNKTPLEDFSRVFMDIGTLASIYIKIEPTDGVGIMYIETRNNEFLHYRLSDILEKYPNIVETGNQLVFRINDRIITDTAGVKIDMAYNIEVTTEKFNAIEYLPQPLRRITIVDIDLEPKETARTKDVCPKSLRQRLEKEFKLKAWDYLKKLQGAKN